MEKTKELLLASNLKRLRQASKLKQDQVAEAIDVNVRTYQQYEYGEIEPSSSTKIELAKLFKVQVSDLFSDSENHRPSSLDVSIAESLTLLYKIAPTLTVENIKKVLDLAASLKK